jgi:hypothetical protein
MTHLLCVSLVEIKAAKSQICIIDRAGHKIPLIPFTIEDLKLGKEEEKSALRWEG